MFSKTVIVLALVAVFPFINSDTVAKESPKPVDPNKTNNVVQLPAPEAGKTAGSVPAPARNDLAGTTTETKAPDGSTITITHFRGQLPPGAIFPPPMHQFVPVPVPFPGYGMYPFPYAPYPYSYKVAEAPVAVKKA